MKPTAKRPSTKRKPPTRKPQLAAKPAPAEPIFDSPVSSDPLPVEPERQAEPGPAPQPEVVSAPITAPEPAQEPVAQAAEPVAEPSDSPERIRLGTSIDGVLYRIPLGDVKHLLGPLEERLAVMQEQRPNGELLSRMRGSDGRCAPAYFTKADGEIPTLFSGLEHIAAAMTLGLEHISVILVPNSMAGELQTFLTKGAGSAPAESEDDLFLRAAAFYEDD